MIRYSFTLSNPFYDTSKWGNQKDYVEFDKEIPCLKNKALSFQVSKFNNGDLISFYFSLSFRGEDHAGLRLDFGLFDYEFLLNFYDTRHWNYSKNRWEDYDKPEKL